MDIGEYAKQAKTTAVYPGRGEIAGLAYATLGLTGAAGEAAERLKKCIRDDQTTRTPEMKARTAKALGDLLWYAAAVASELRLDLDEIAQANLAKLADRAERGVLLGSGDDR